MEMIIPLKHENYGDLKSICMHHPEHGSCTVCFCEFSEVEELLSDGWKISDDQNTIYDWIDKIKSAGSSVGES